VGMDMHTYSQTSHQDNIWHIYTAMGK